MRILPDSKSSLHTSSGHAANLICIGKQWAVAPDLSMRQVSDNPTLQRLSWNLESKHMAIAGESETCPREKIETCFDVQSSAAGPPNRRDGQLVLISRLPTTLGRRWSQADATRDHIQTPMLLPNASRRIRAVQVRWDRSFRVFKIGSSFCLARCRRLLTAANVSPNFLAVSINESC